MKLGEARKNYKNVFFGNYLFNLIRRLINYLIIIKTVKDRYGDVDNLDDDDDSSESEEDEDAKVFSFN